MRLELKNATAFLAVWEAVAQYVENLDEIDGDDMTPDELEKLKAAQEVLAEMDAAHASLAKDA